MTSASSVRATSSATSLPTSDNELTTLSYATHIPDRLAPTQDGDRGVGASIRCAIGHLTHGQRVAVFGLEVGQTGRQECLVARPTAIYSPIETGPLEHDRICRLL
jgi:hypothetical protein